MREPTRSIWQLIVGSSTTIILGEHEPCPGTRAQPNKTETRPWQNLQLQTGKEYKELPRTLAGKNKAGPKGWVSSRRSCISSGCFEVTWEKSWRKGNSHKVLCRKAGGVQYVPETDGQEEGGTGWRGQRARRHLARSQRSQVKGGPSRPFS